MLPAAVRAQPAAVLLGGGARPANEQDDGVVFVLVHGGRSWHRRCGDVAKDAYIGRVTEGARPSRRPRAGYKASERHGT